MTALFGCWIRRTAGVVGLVAAVALIAAPAALANGDTITAAAGVQFSGVVDAGASCAPLGSPTIQWGDGSSSAGTYNSSTNSVSGTHTYASSTTFSGKVLLTGGTCTAGAVTTDTFTANVGPAPQFTQCPPVGVDFGCQFLIDVTPGGTTVLQDSTQGPYEASEDALIGIKNDSSSPLSSIPITTPNSGTFSFDGDGLCDNGSGPVPAGCVQIGTAGTPCDPTSSTPCAFPSPADQTAPDPDPYTGSNANGYEGPQNYYTNISADFTSGTVVFSPAIPPGGSTYFSLEEPPSAASINVGSAPVNPSFIGAPTLTATGASFNGLVNPNGSNTTVVFQYGLDLKYTKPGASGPNYTNSVPATPAPGGDFANHFVSATASGLVPNALYHARMAATNANGTTYGPDITFTTGHGPVPGAPTLGKNFNISLVSGLILIKINGVFIPLTEVTQIPKNTVIDALNGTLTLVTAGGSHPAADVAAKKGKGKGKGKTTTQSGTFGGAIFKISQATGGANKGLATLTIVENAFKGAPSYSLCTKHKAAEATAAKASSRTLQLLKASAKGKFSTKGKYSAATVLGTKWTVADRCDGTFTHDLTDSVQVTDFVHHKTITLHAGQSYLATKP
jgi:hypothetical protein